MNIRLAKPADIDTVEAIMDDARKYLGSQGLPQWQDGYGPNRAALDDDVKLGRGYVLEIDGAVHGYAAIQHGPDDSYEALANGSWNGPGGPYIVVHRVMIGQAKRGQRIGAAFMNMLAEEARRLGCKDIRIDTHPGNVIMKKVITDSGFVQCGDIMMNIPNGERVAYQRML